MYIYIDKNIDRQIPIVNHRKHFSEFHLDITNPKVTSEKAL